MNKQSHKLIIYEFNIEAVSPVYFGATEQKELVKDSQGAPILFGNSVGGALRDYLEACDAPEDTVYTYMGGDRNNEFLPSLLYISDGEITGYHEFGCQEGTAIDPICGSARKNHKYMLEYLPEGSVITFRIEYETEDYAEETKFHTIIGTWAQGFRTKSIRLGGQQNNGWGKFTLQELKKKEFVFRTPADLDEYIFKPSARPFTAVNERELPWYEMAKPKQVIFSLKGEFPYGVYQAFKDKGNSQLTGVQRRGDTYYLPASSFKGIMRSEVRVLLGKFLNAEMVDAKLNEIFGNKDRKGKILFADVVLENSGPVKVKRFDKDKKPEEDSIYIKIDRLTGGAFEGALKKQREIWGSAILQCQLRLEQKQEQDQDQAFLFMLIYVLRRIGSGLVPLGGRTVAGLGEFTGSKVKLTGAIEEDISTDHHLSPQQINRMRAYYNAFEGWCGKCSI